MPMSKSMTWLAIPCVLAVLAVPARAAESPVVLRVGDSLPVGHFLSEYATKPWMQAVTQAIGAKVKFEYFPAEQLGKAKDLLALTASGVIDVGYVVPAYVPDKLPLSGVAELPGSFASSCAGTSAYWKLANGGILGRQEFAPRSVRPLFSLVLSPYQIFTARHPIDSLASFEGLKLQTTGGAKEAMVRKLKAVPVRVAGPEMYESLSRGTIDGLLLPYASISSYDLQKLVRYATQGANFGSVVTTYVISEAKLKRLPEEVRAALIAAGDRITQQACAKVDQSVMADTEKLRAEGVTMQRLSPALRTSIGRLGEEVAVEWARALDKRALPGTEVLKQFREALKP